MKHLFVLCLCLMHLFAEDVYLLPHRWQDARHQLNGLISTAEHSVVIVSDTISDSHLRRSLRRALEEGKSILLITGSMSTASQWAIYRTLDACILPSRESLTFSLVGADEARICTLGAPLDTDAMRSRSSMLYCSDAGAFSETLRLLRQECTPYFGKQ